MEAMQVQGGSRDWQKWNQLKCLLNEAYKEEEEFWSRKATVTWLKEGEKNTKFFHAVTNERRKRNKIEVIVDEQGKECRAAEDIAGEIRQYFEKLFTTSHPEE